MIAQCRYPVGRNRATKLLVSRGYDPVFPVTGSFLSRYIPLNLIGMRGDLEALCVKILYARDMVSASSAESLFKDDIIQFRSFLKIYPGGMYLRCEVWVVSHCGSIHCYEVTATEVREVAAYAW